MKYAFLLAVFFIHGTLASCSKKSGSSDDPAPPGNHVPTASLSASVKSTDPLTIHFTVTASDADNDPLQYHWNSGNGTTTDGQPEADFTYAAGKDFTATVSVTDGKSDPLVLSLHFSSTVRQVSVTASERHQQMTGFGGFGAKDVYWSGGPYTSTDFVNTLINDLGVTVLRDNIPTDFESVNDDADPNTTDLSKFKYGGFTDHIQYLKDMKAAGLKTLIITSWSPPAWMKTNNNVNGLKADAPAYNSNPGSADNQLRTDMYEEFAERCVAYIRIVKQKTGLDVYGISLQNEPRFTEPYESCVFNGEALRDLIKVVGRRFAHDGITAKIFMPEDVGYFDGIRGLIQPILADAEAMSYVGMVATHGYAFDGVTAASTDAQTWDAMYQWGAAQGKPLWMTETSGFSNNMQGALDLSKAMYTALRFGNVSAWLFWSLSTSTLDTYTLMSSAGEKSKRYYASEQFYKYIRPDAYRVTATSDDAGAVYPLAFVNDADQTKTIVLVNDNEMNVPVKITGADDTHYELLVTDSLRNCLDLGAEDISGGLLVPARSVITLYHQ
ncbi:MAG TPA: PKD domain-containing protein [Puia sp.]|nr:PKD domain-containing protein [Puia sp.]